jgi:hypothetical protein
MGNEREKKVKEGGVPGVGWGCCLADTYLVIAGGNGCAFSSSGVRCGGPKRCARACACPNGERARPLRHTCHLCVRNHPPPVSPLSEARALPPRAPARVHE